ncbi:dde superfamily endonuclease [Holotrichia oblita]|uniref:Dde superfamily endonuclease n=1 Tax=Holotrichia oblita TaxID=644536 RepID=A0ACB9T673_HOLOL|nr:dde superfamily endonuclease [Holotrichia oblita]
MDDIYEQLTDDEDFVELIRIVENRRAPKPFMQRRDHFNIWTEQEFRRYRLSKDTVRFVIHEILNKIANNTASSQEHLFNESQIRTRNPIERCFGIWKRRFPILSTGIKLNYDKVESIVLATAVLHNIARQRNEPEDPIDAVLQEHIEINVEVPPGAIRTK